MTPQPNASGHTPGPWEAELYRDGAFDIVTEKIFGGALIITSRSRHMSRADEMHANARLIAKAPDLLAERDRLQAEVDSLRSGRILSRGDAQIIMDSVSMLESAAVLLPEHEIGMRCQAHLLRQLHAALKEQP